LFISISHNCNFECLFSFQYHNPIPKGCFLVLISQLNSRMFFFLVLTSQFQSKMFFSSFSISQSNFQMLFLSFDITIEFQNVFFLRLSQSNSQMFLLVSASHNFDPTSFCSFRYHIQIPKSFPFVSTIGFQAILFQHYNQITKQFWQ
jgi:hypothetical protein